MPKLFALIVAAMLLTGCGSLPFTPTEYPLRAGLIPELPLAGTVAVSNAQPAVEPMVIYRYMGQRIEASPKALTEVMVQQTQTELKKNGKPTGASGEKTLQLRIDSLLSEYTYAFFWRSKVHFQATLGDGQVIDLTVPHASGSVQQDLNGCIAEGVMVLLKDPRVRDYLSK